MTLRHIAEQAGVSRQTVSRALRNQTVLPEKTRTRIRKIADRMGYVPDPKVAELMVHLRNPRKREQGATLALLWDTPDGGEDFDWRNYRQGQNEVVGARERAGELGYGVDEFCLRHNTIDARHLSRMIWSRGIAGVIVAGFAYPGSTLRLDWKRFSAVTLGYSLKSPELTRICTDHFNTMLQIMRKVQQAGYRRIGLVISRRLDDRVRNKWRAGYLTHINLHPSLAFIPPLIGDGLTREHFNSWFGQWKPDVIVGGGATEGTTLDWLRKLKLTVPEEIGYVCLGQGENDNGLTSGMDHLGKEKGRMAVDVLVKQLHADEFGLPRHPTTLLIPAKWIPGQTIRPLPPGSAVARNGQASLTR